MSATWPLLREKFAAWTGMALGENRAADALRALVEIAADGGHRDAATCLAAADADDALRGRLVERLAIGATWFLREPGPLERLVANLAAHARASGLRQARVWSVGCSTGEEPYTLAMMLLDAGLQPVILATDLSVGALRTAAAARYGKHQLERLPDRWHVRWLDGGVVAPEVRRCVSFARHNFALQDCPPDGWSPFDAVVCRNVLIYFEPVHAVALANKLTRACRAGGWLVVGAVEEAMVATFEGLSPDGALARRPPRLASGTPAPGALPAVAPRNALLDAAEHLAAGISHKRARRFRDAVERFRRARFLRPDAWLAPYELAVCLEHLGEATGALEAYRHALTVVERGGPTGLADDEPLARELGLLARTVAGTCRARLEVLTHPHRSRGGTT